MEIHVFRTERRDGASLTAADAVLAAIPTTLLVVLLAGLAVSLSIRTALALGTLPASGTIGYALFWNPPDAVEE